MKPPRSRHQGFFTISLVCFALLMMLAGGCAIVKPVTDPAMDARAKYIAAQARGFNQGVESSRGIGRVTVISDSRTDKFKIAWAAQAPNRLRLTFLSYGHPVETIVATGKRVTFVSHTGEHKPHTTISADPDLERFIRLPVKLSALTCLLLGRIPIQNYDDAWFETDPASPIILKKNWNNDFQKLILNTDGRVSLLKHFEKELVYEIRYLEYQAINSFVIPSEIKVMDRDGRTITISLERFTPNPPLKESVFRLTESGS